VPQKRTLDRSCGMFALCHKQMSKLHAIFILASPRGIV
jgi:hypothetical protein